jgi:hypothetical protein
MGFRAGKGCKMSIKVSQPNWSMYKDEIGFNVSISLNSLQSDTKNCQSIQIGIAEAVKAYVQDKEAARLFSSIEGLVKEEIEKTVKEYVKKEALSILKTLDLDSLAKLATISAAKELGKEMVK